MSITGDLIRGNTDTIILALLMRHDSYGYEINKAVLAASDGRFELKEATLYTSFRRLEDSGLIASYWGDENTGARRRYYRITAAGRDEYMRMLRDWRETRDLIDKLTKGEDGYGN